MYFTNASTAAAMISDLAHDAWRAREHLVSKSNDNDFFTLPDAPKMAIEYRVSISDTKTHDDVNFYFHIVFSRNRWWFTVSNKSHFEVDSATLIFQENEDDYSVQCTSWRHYAFDDLVKSMIETKIEAVNTKLKNPGRIYLWGTLDIRKFI